MYLRSVLFRLAGALVGALLFAGMLLFLFVPFFTAATESPDGPGIMAWIPWLAALGITVGVYFVRRSLGPGPGWATFAAGLVIGWIGFVVVPNAGPWLWLAVLALILVPMPAPKAA